MRIDGELISKMAWTLVFDQIWEWIYTLFNDDQEKKQWYEQLKQLLVQKVMNQTYSDNNKLFATASSHSANDAFIFNRDFFEMYKNVLSKFSDLS